MSKSNEAENVVTEEQTKKEFSFPIVCPGHSRPVVDVRFSDVCEDGIFLVNGCHDKLPMLRWGDNGDWIGTFEGHKGAVWSSCFNKDATKVATGSGDFSARIWDAITGSLLHTLDHKHIVKTVEFSKSDEKLLTGGHEKILRVFNLKAAELPCIVSMNTPAPIRKASWLDEELVICACDDGTVQVWNINDQQNVPKTTWKLPDAIKDLEFCYNMSTVTIAAGHTAYFYDSQTFDFIKKVDFAANIEGASLNPINGKEFIVGGADLYVHVIDFESGKEIHCHKGHHGPIFCLRYAPNGEVYASGSEDATIRLWKHSNENQEIEE